MNCMVARISDGYLSSMCPWSATVFRHESPCTGLSIGHYTSVEARSLGMLQIADAFREVVQMLHDVRTCYIREDAKTETRRRGIIHNNSAI
jgi:hypothetical protein